MLYVKGQKGDRFLVDADGKKYQLPETSSDNLTRALVRTEPQSVTDDWLATLHTGKPVDFPAVPGTVGDDAGVGGGLSPEQDRVGMVLRAQTGSGLQHYVVLRGKVQPVSDFTAWLLINSPQTDTLDMAGKATAVDAQSFAPETDSFYGTTDWPEEKPLQINAVQGEGARDTVCSVLRKVDDKGRTTLSTW